MLGTIASVLGGALIGSIGGTVDSVLTGALLGCLGSRVDSLFGALLQRQSALGSLGLARNTNRKDGSLAGTSLTLTLPLSLSSPSSILRVLDISGTILPHPHPFHRFSLRPRSSHHQRS